MLRHPRTWLLALGFILAMPVTGMGQEEAGQADGSRQPRVTVKDYTPPKVEDALEEEPVRPPKAFPTPTWRDPAALSDEELENETARLKKERAARVQALADFEAELERLATVHRQTRSEDRRKELNYDIALARFRIAAQNRLIRLISERLDVLAAERVARSQEKTPPRISRDITDLSNVQQAHEALLLLRKYDEAVAQILRRDPLSESDIIYALGLLKEKEPVAAAVEAYFAELEEQARTTAEEKGAKRK